MNKQQTEELYELKQKSAYLFNCQCYVCGKTFSYGRAFTYHHKRYLKNDKTYKDFKSTLEYYQYLIPIIIQNPQRFLLLCNPHHQSLERLKRFNRNNFNKLVKAVRMSR